MSEYAQISGTGGEDDLALIKLVLAGDLSFAKIPSALKIVHC
jgi:hypothetical protein